MTSNSFIANVNFLAQNFNSIQEVWEVATKVSRDTSETATKALEAYNEANRARDEANRAAEEAATSVQKAAEAVEEALRAKEEADRAADLNAQNLEEIATLTLESNIAINNNTAASLDSLRDALATGKEEIERLCTLLHLESGVYNTRAAFYYNNDITAGDEVSLPVFYYPKRNTLLVIYKGTICTPSGIGSDTSYSYEEVGDDHNVPSDKLILNFDVKAGEYFDVWVVTSAYGKNLDILEAIKQAAQDLLDEAKQRIEDFTGGSFINNATYDKQTGDLTFTWKDNSTLTINVLADTLLQGLDYDASTDELVLVKTDGTVIRVDVSKLVDTYTGVENDHIQLTINSDKEVEAILKKDSITVDDMVPELRESLEEIANKVAWLNEDEFIIANEAEGWFEDTVDTGELITLPVYYYPTRNALILFYHGLQCTPRKDITQPAGIYQYEEVGDDPNVLSNQVRVFFDVEYGDDLYAWVASSVVTVRGKAIEYFFDEFAYKLEQEVLKLEKYVKDALDGFTDDFDTKFNALKDEIDAKLEEFKQGLEDLRSEIYNRLRQLRQMIMDEAKAIYDRINNEVTILNARIDDEVAKLNQRIDDEVATLNARIDDEVATLNQKIDDLRAWAEEQFDIQNRKNEMDYANPKQYISPLLKGDTVLIAPSNGVITGMIGPAGGGGGLYQVKINGTPIIKQFGAPGNQTIPIYASVTKGDIIVITCSASGSSYTFYQFIPNKEII